MNGMVKPKTYGRMGNFLFQAATAIGYASKWGLPYTLPNTTKNPKWNPIYLQHLVNPHWDPSLAEALIKETSHGFQSLPFNEEWRGSHNIILDGYWQTEKYFKEYRNEVLKAFAFKWNPRPGWVSVHVRRTDYIKLAHKHPPVTAQWYTEAMARFPGMRFVFFSDDIPWCRENFGKRNDVWFSVCRPEEEDLVHMSECEHHVCSASTFSWWGAWLNQNPEKQIIIPKLWFVPGHNNLDTSDIVPEEWTRL